MSCSSGFVITGAPPSIFLALASVLTRPWREGIERFIAATPSIYVYTQPCAFTLTLNPY
jgi:hypothetical protein